MELPIASYEDAKEFSAVRVHLMYEDSLAFMENPDLVDGVCRWNQNCKLGMVGINHDMDCSKFEDTSHADGNDDWDFIGARDNSYGYDY